MYRLIAVILLHSAVIVYCQNVDCNQPPPDITGSECCPGSAIFDPSNMKECLDKYGEMAPAMPEGQKACITECLFNTTKLIKDNKLDKTIAMNLASKLPSEYQLMWTTIIEKCSSELDSKIGELSKPVEYNSNVCGLSSKFLSECSCRATFEHCPADKFLNNALCNAKKEYVQSCPKKD